MGKQNQDSGDRTEKPTAKRLRDARKDGDVHKSRELTSTVLVLGWFAMVWMAMDMAIRRLSELVDAATSAINQPFDVVVPQMGRLSLETLLWLSVPFLGAAIVLAVMTDFLQVGAVFAPKRIKPDVSRLNPVEGIKKLFSQENLIEVIKAAVKSAALIAICVFVLFALLPQYIKLPFAQHVGVIGHAFWVGMVRIGVWVIFVFFFVSVLDAFYQRFAFMKRLRMSRRDIRQELKENEGDPHVKGRRRQLHQEWAQQNMLAGVRKSSVVVVNPTHLAIALLYEAGATELPVIVAKGEDYEAALIRKAAEEAGVPIMRNVELAHGMYERVEVGDYLPSDFFEAVAELLHWAESVRRERDGLK